MEMKRASFILTVRRSLHDEKQTQQVRGLPVGYARFEVLTRISPKGIWTLGLLATLLPYAMLVIVGGSWFPTIPGETPIAYETYSWFYFDQPVREIVRNIVAQHQFPWMNFYSSLGWTIPGQVQTQIFNPLEWVELWLPIAALNVTFMAKVGVAYLGTSLLARQLGVHTKVAPIAGVLYGLSAYFMWFTTIASFVNVAMVLPWTVIAIIRLARGDGRPVVSAAVAALAVSWLAVSGQIQIAIISVIFLVPIALVVFLSSSNSLKRRVVQIASFILSGTLVLLLLGPWLYVVSHALRNGYTIHSPGAYRGGGTVPANLVSSVFPMAFGGVHDPYIPSLFPTKVVTEGFPLSLGLAILLPLTVAVLSLRNRLRLDKQQHLALVVMAFIIMIALLVVVAGTYGVSVWLGPGIDRLNLPRYVTPLVALFVSVLVSVWTESCWTTGSRQANFACSHSGLSGNRCNRMAGSAIAGVLACR